MNGFFGGPQEAMSETNVFLEPDSRSVRPTVGNDRLHSLKELLVDVDSVGVIYSSDGTQGFLSLLTIPRDLKPETDFLVIVIYVELDPHPRTMHGLQTSRFVFGFQCEAILRSHNRKGKPAERWLWQGN